MYMYINSFDRRYNETAIFLTHREIVSMGESHTYIYIDIYVCVVFVYICAVGTCMTALSDVYRRPCMHVFV